MRVKAEDIEFYDVIHHESAFGRFDFEVRSTRAIASGCLIRVEGRRTDGQGKHVLSFQPDTLVEVDR